MAFAKTGFNTLSPGKAGINLFVYKTSDAEATVEASGYFNDVATTLTTGDFIIASMSASDKLYKVTVTSGVVTTAEVRTFKAPDTAIASLTDSSGGTANDTVEAIGATYSQSEVRNNFADVTAKVNAILAALRNHGVIAS